MPLSITYNAAVLTSDKAVNIHTWSIILLYERA